MSEAGVNRRPSAAQILTANTDSFKVGQHVYVDGVKPGRIQYIGETKFGPGDWAGVVLDERLGRNDGSVGKVRYFQCEPGYGVFSRLFRLTAEPIEGATEVLSQMKRYGYELLDSPVDRRGSVGSGGGSRRGSTSVDDRRGSTDRGSMSPRSGTPELRRSSMNRGSPDRPGMIGARRTSGAAVAAGIVEPRRTSLTVPERRGSASSPMGRRTPGKSPLASPRQPRSHITGGDVRIEKDPDMTRLAQEARRLSMGATGVNTGRASSPPKDVAAPKRPSITRANANGLPRNGVHKTSANSHNGGGGGISNGGIRRQSDAAPSNMNRLFGGPKRPSISSSGGPPRTRKISDGLDTHNCAVHRESVGECIFLGEWIRRLGL